MTNPSQRPTPGSDSAQPSRNRQPKSRASTRRSVVKRRTIVAALALSVTLLALMAVACGGGENGEETSPTAPVADGSPAVSPTGEAVFPAPCQELEALKTYRYVTEMKLESPEPTGTPSPDQPTPTSTITQDFTAPFLFEYNVEASVVVPDRLDAYVTGTTSPMSIIIIGDQNWINTGTTWNESVSPLNVTYRPLDVCKTVLPDLDLSQAQPQPETINDTDTLHYSFSQVSSQATATLFGVGSDMDFLLRILDVEIWLAEEDNRLVRIEVESSGLYADSRELQLHLVGDVRDADDNSIRVDPPF
jgi:hypothetical protein